MRQGDAISPESLFSDALGMVPPPDASRRCRFDEETGAMVAIDLTSLGINQLDATLFLRLPDALHIDLRGNAIPSIDLSPLQSQWSDTLRMVSGPGHTTITWGHKELLVDTETSLILTLTGSYHDGRGLKEPVPVNTVERLSLNGRLISSIDLSPLRFAGKLRSFDLSGNSMEKHAPDLKPLKYCPALEMLDLSGDITLASAEPNISMITLVPMPGLKRLFLKKNDLSRIDLTPLSESPLLELLDLSWNWLKTIDISPLAPCCNLQQLHLGSNGLTEIGDEVCAFAALRTLGLALNKLTRIPQEIGRLTSLESLDLNHNQLTGLPASLGELKSLRFLGLSGNALTEIPSTIDRLTNLTTLTLHRTFPRAKNRTLLERLLTIPGPLEHLNLACNNLDLVPESLKNRSSIRHLDLSYNSLVDIPAWMADWKCLEELDISGNPFTGLPEVLFRMKSLRQLLLKDIQVPALPPALATELPSLKFVRLPARYETDPVTRRLRERAVEVFCRDGFL
jgi:Leucine-rich repeat (LRR) protein